MWKKVTEFSFFPKAQYLTPSSCVSPVNLPCNFTPAVAASPLRQVSIHTFCASFLTIITIFCLSYLIYTQPSK